MGKVIDAQKDFQQHQELSQALDGFARRVVPQIIREYQGSLVYSGGDDIMALVPLHTVLQCAQELRKNYEQVMSDYRDSQGRSSTLSAGIAIMHHLELLQEAVKLARVAEEQAKSLEDKNALAITISKRGGEPVHFAAKWERVDILERLITWYRDDLLPHGTAYELRDLVQRLTVLAQENDKAEIQAVIKRDAWRILRRKLNDWQSARTKEAQKQVQERANMLKNWLDIPLDDRANQTTSQENSLEQQSSPFSVDELIHALIVAEILADAQRLATPVKKEIKQ
jgi:CRISPR-associated protein Cmr2